MIKKILKESILIFVIAGFIFIVGMIVINIYSFSTTKNPKAYQVELIREMQENDQIKISATPALIIPALAIRVPIIFSKSNNENEVMRDLESGVSHRVNSANPGEKGNVFLEGHSSFYSWEKGDYKEVFMYLDALNNNDRVYLDYNNERFTYKIIDKKIVSASDLSVISQPQDKKLVSLMTCYPPGTTLKRLVVTGELIEP